MRNKHLLFVVLHLCLISMVLFHLLQDEKEPAPRSPMFVPMSDIDLLDLEIMADEATLVLGGSYRTLILLVVTESYLDVAENWLMHYYTATGLQTGVLMLAFDDRSQRVGGETWRTFLSLSLFFRK